MIEAVNIKIEHLTEAFGIDIVSPEIYWNVSGAVKQTAYQLVYRVNGAEEVFCEEQHTDLMHGNLGRRFSSRDRVEFRIRLRDENKKEGPWSEWKFFEIGLLSLSDWKAHWIMGDYEHSEKPDVRYPADCFCQKFSCKKKIKHARFYITACGVYEAYLNGKKIGDRILSPGSTAFQKRVHYQTYDVTEALAEENELKVDLADGFYASRTGCFNKAKTFGYKTKVLYQMEIEYEDGTKDCVLSGNQTRWSNDGPVLYADMKDGETIDSRRIPSLQENARLTSYKGKICADNNVKVLEKEKFHSPKIIHCPNGQIVLDFGQNIAGYVEFSVQGPSGHKVTMVCGEKLDDEGIFTVKNINLKGEYTEDRFQMEEFICNGERQTYKPRFTVMGFQYVLLLDWPEEVHPENFTAIAVYSDMPVTGTFACSDEGVNQIVKNTLWSMKGNFLDVPTDCPTRERAGWTGDAQLFFNTGNYLMDQAAFFRKWLWDVEDCQKKNGMVYNINPSRPGGNSIYEWLSVEGGVGWGDAFLAIPYFYWKRYGDDSLIRSHWDAMVKCFDFYKKRIGKKNLFTLFKRYQGKAAKYVCACGRDFGEWTEPDDCAPGKASLMFPHPEESTAYVSYDAGIMAEMAGHLGKENLQKTYDRIHKMTAVAYVDNFLSEDLLNTNRMAKLVRPVALGLARGKRKEVLLQKCVELNRKRDYKVGTGFLSTPFVLHCLTEAGAIGDAYKMLVNPELGWMKQVKEGATTVWENWTNDASLNHYSKGACCQWLFEDICGIQMGNRPNHFRLAPKTVPQLTHASMTYASIYGKVSCGWKQIPEGYEFSMEIPANCTAELILPKQEKRTLGSGSYAFQVKEK